MATTKTPPKLAVMNREAAPGKTYAYRGSR